jgi:hypothetical protein
VFDEMQERGVAAWNTMVSGLVLQRDVLTLVSLASAVAECGYETSAKSLHCYVTAGVGCG